MPALVTVPGFGLMGIHDVFVRHAVHREAFLCRMPLHETLVNPSVTSDVMHDRTCR
jgi:hypothetical protein